MTHTARISIALLVVITAIGAFALGRQTAPTLVTRLDNERVTVTESATPAAGRREPYTRPTDQVLVFLDDAEYESVDASGKVTPRTRKSGDIVWHTKGEAAPLLINKGKAYRNLIIALK